MPARVATVDPRFLTLTRWASETAWNLAPFATIPILRDETAWQDWARYVIGIPSLNALGAPRPEGFSRWEDWGQALNQTIRLLTLPV